MKVYETNFDGLVGPTHNYAGLSYGNLASSNNKAHPANPKLAALQGLAKMKALNDLGLIQGVIPPHERPDIATLKRVGFSGSDAHIVAQAAKHSPELLASCYSASSMWTANAATVSPSSDTKDGKVHITPANLVSKLHRSLEHETTGKILQGIFHEQRYFIHHPALPSVAQLGDEGAANHTRFCENYGDHGIAFFVFGSYGLRQKDNTHTSTLFPARQTYEASSAIARQHQLTANRVVYAQQNPEVIDQGVFHNDVIAVGNKNTLFCHEKSFVDQANVYQQLRNATNKTKLSIIEVANDRISVEDAVSSYLFNSQLLTIADRNILVISTESENNKKVFSYLTELIESNNAIKETVSFDLRQSMKNGGGPACLRLRVVLTEQELSSVNQACLFSNELYNKLTAWINKHYRDKLSDSDLADPQLLEESRTALEHLTCILNLGSVYPFQR